MMKKFLSIALACLFILSSVSVFAATEYRDVPTTFWGHDAIMRTTDKNWFSGYPDGNFKPNASITRAEAMKVFVTFLGLELRQVSQTSYYDVKAKDWYAPYIEAGKKLFPARTQFNGQTPFQPDMPITREDAVYALVIATRYSDEVTFADQSILNMYSDQNSISAAIKPYIAVATKLGLVSGYADGSFGGQDPLTRAEFATVLYRASTVGFGDSELDLSDDTASVVSVALTPESSAQMNIGETLNLTALATYSNGLTADYTTELIAYVEEGSSVTANKNVLKAVSSGVSTIKFSNSELADKSIVVVVQAPESDPTITASAERETTNATAVITGRASDPSGATFKVTCDNREVAVNSSGEFKETVDLEVGVNTFVYTVKNQYGRTDSATVKIRRNAVVEENDEDEEETTTRRDEEDRNNSDDEGEATLVSYSWSVDSLELDAGETSKIKLIGTYSDGSTKDLTREYSLNSTNSDVVTVSSNGTIKAVGEGSAKITMGSSLASAATVARPLTVKVRAAQEAEMEALEWSTGDIEMSNGDIRSIKLYAVFSDGTKKDVTSECGIYAMDESVAVVRDGEITALSSGTTELWFDSMPSAGIDLPDMLNVTVN